MLKYVLHILKYRKYNKLIIIHGKEYQNDQQKYSLPLNFKRFNEKFYYQKMVQSTINHWARKDASY